MEKAATGPPQNAERIMEILERYPENMTILRYASSPLVLHRMMSSATATHSTMLNVVLIFGYDNLRSDMDSCCL